LFLLVKKKKGMRLKSILIWLMIISKKATMLMTISKSLWLLKILENVRVIDQGVQDNDKSIDNRKETIKRKNMLIKKLVKHLKLSK
jgi:hypothetical protein